MKQASDESHYLGQFIPLHYHHNMLLDERRMSGFKAAIGRVVPAGARVVDLGGGTGVLSWFAAAHAEKVWCVEFNPELVAEARALLCLNEHGERVEVVHADAMEFLPPEPADVVICEMAHAAMLREKQIEIVDSFRRRHLERFPGRLPVFVPEATLLGVQPIEQDFHFHGFHAPIIQFQAAGNPQPATRELAAPAVYSRIDYSLANDAWIEWDGELTLEHDGIVNALRFVTCNLLAIVPAQGSSIEWFNQHLVLPIAEALPVRAGDRLRVAFGYRAGGAIDSLRQSLTVTMR